MIARNPSEIKWSKLGLGTGTLASFSRSVSVAEAERLTGTMMELGVTVIDTADTYGSGDCEVLVGKVLRGRRSSFTLVTKAGYRHSNLHGPLRPLNQFIKKGIQKLGARQRFDAKYLIKCLEQSLSRLRMEQVEAFLLHDPPLEIVTQETIQRACADLKKSGKTIMTGVSSGDPSVLMAAIESGAFDVIQTPAGLGAAAMMRAVWQECAARGIHVIGNHVFEPTSLSIPGMTHQLLMSGSSALLPPTATILCGTRNSGHLRQSLDWARAPLQEEEAQRLVHILSQQNHSA